MAKKSAFELFEHYYQALYFSLPMKDGSFIEELFARNVFTEGFKNKLKTLSLSKERASCLLDKIVKSELLVGNNKCFAVLLNVMNNHKYDNVRDLADQIDSELDMNAKCKLIIIPDNVMCVHCIIVYC